MITINPIRFKNIVEVLNQFGINERFLFQYGLSNDYSHSKIYYKQVQDGHWVKVSQEYNTELSFNNETDAVNDWFTTFKNDPVVSQFTYHSYYYHGIFCDVVTLSDGPAMVTSDCFLSVASQLGFSRKVGTIIKPLEKYPLTGYNNFGETEVNGYKYYWASLGDNPNGFPTKLNYYLVTLDEYNNRYVLKDTVETEMLISLSPSDASNTLNEQNVIASAIRGKFYSPKSQVPFVANNGNVDNNKKDKKKDKKVKKEKVNKKKINNNSQSTPNNYQTPNDMIRNPVRRKRKKHTLRNIFIVLFILALLVGIAGFFAYPIIEKYIPTEEKQDMYEYFHIKENSSDVAVIWNDELIETKAKMINDSVYMSYEFIHEYLNSRLYIDFNEDVLLYATSSNLIEAHSNSNAYTVDGTSSTYEHVIYQKDGDSVWINLDFLKQYSRFDYKFYSEPNRIVLTTYISDTKVQVMTTTKSTPIRVLGGTKSPILKKADKDEELVVLESGETWTKVRDNTGITGYINNAYLNEITENTLTFEYAPIDNNYKHNFMDEPISLGWHQVTSVAANENVNGLFDNRKSINVVSPTWFYLDDDEGNIADVGSKDYVTYCHDHGVKVWGLISNLENPDVSTTNVLSHTSSRRHLEDEIINAIQKYELDGINIDFESLNIDAGAGFVQFIRELALKLDNTDVILSVDNYVPMGYTAFYNREEQALFADYVIIMGYDQHTSGSEEAGSTAGLSWVQDGVSNTLDEVPAEQVILGMPLYTRIWKTDKDGISSTLYGMDSVDEVIKNHDAKISWDEENGQNYAIYKDGDDSYQIWIEDEKSLEKKLDIMKNENLAGAAYWKLGLEKNSVWSTIDKYFK